MALPPAGSSQKNAEPVFLSQEDRQLLADIQAAAAAGASGTIGAAGAQTAKTATGAGDQVIAAANVVRKSFSFTNNHATVAVRVMEGAVASAVSGIRVLPGGTYFADTQDAIHVCPESGNADCFGYEVAQ